MLACTLNFTRAAEELHIAQPPLSQQIQQLECEIGVPLLDRSRPLRLTEAGRFFQEHSNLLLAQLDRVCEDTRRVASGNKRWLGIGFARLLFDAPSITQQMVHEDPLVAALPAGHALLGAPVSLQQLAAEPFILYPGSPRPSYADHVLGVFALRGLSIHLAQMANELQTAIGLVAAGMGITLVPASVQRLHRDDIGYTPLLDASVSSPIVVSYRAGDKSTVLKACLELLGISELA